MNVYYKRNVYNVTFWTVKDSGSWWNPTYEKDKEITEKRITAKYEENIKAKWPGGIWATSPGGSTFQSNIDTMPLNGTEFFETDQGNAKAYYYLEDLNGQYVLDHTDTGASSGSTVTEEDRYPITGFTCNTTRSPKNGASYNGAKFYYDRNSYKVVYINNGVEEHTASYLYEKSIADAGNHAPARPSTIPDSYTFAGWYDDPSGEQEYVFTGKTMPAQNITVYAKWNEPIVNGKAHITIDGTDTGTTLENVTYGGTITNQLNALQATIMQDKDGYTWRGWRTGPNGTGEPFNVDTKIYSDIILYPYYTKDGTFSVTYVVAGENSSVTGVKAPTDSKAYADDSFADLMAPEPLVSEDGQYFLGWSDGNNIYQPRDKYKIKDNVTFIGVWGARPAGTTLTYKANGGAGEDKVENLDNNATVTTRPGTTFSRVGYTFKGWDTDPEGEGSIAPNTQVQVDNKDGENVLYAIWTANTDTKYTVEFYYQNVNGTYTLDHSDKRTATTDTEVSVTDADKAAKENNKYVFEADNKNNVLSGNVAGDGSLVLKLYFKLNTASYTIHHYLNGTTVKVADDQTGAMTIGEELTANKSNALYLAYAAAEVAVYAPSQTITIVADESKNVITVYYTVPLSITAEDANKTYDGQPLTQPDFTMEGLVNGDTKENFTLSMTAESTITNAGSTPNVINTDTVKYNGGAIPSYYNVSYNPGTLTVNKASATVTITGVNKTHVYDGKQHEANGYNYSFTGKPNEITISLKPNVLAIARRTDVGTTYMGLTKDSFTVTSANYDVTIKEVIDGYVTITPITEKQITITANSASKTYDGTPLTDGGSSFTEGVLVKGDVLTAVVEGSATNVGDEGKNVVKSYKVMRGDVDVTGNYTFGNSIDGKLTINKRKVTLKSADLSKTYDGTPLVNGKTALATEDGFVSGEGATYTFTGSQTVVGSSANAFTYTLNEGTNAGNYEVAKTEGTLTVTQNEKAITITANSHTWEYDGQAHSDGGYTVEYDGKTYKVEAGETATLPTGDVVKAKITKTVTNVSDSAAGNNTIDELTIVNAAGEDTKGQYKTVTLIPGTLTITKRGAGEEKVKITAADNTVEYDGQPHGAKLNAAGQIEVNVSYTTEYLAPGHKVQTVAIDGSQTAVGKYPKELVPSGAIIVDKNDNDVTENYVITYVPGTLEIRKNETEIKVTANSHTWEYDGQAHSDGGYTVNYNGVDYPVAAGEFATLPTGDKVTATVDGSVTNVADSADDNNVVTNVTITNKTGTVVSDQYKTITRVNGGLKITRRGDSEDEDKKVKIIAEPNTVGYDGQSHGAKLNAAGEIELGTSYTTARLVDGHYVDETTLDITGSQMNVGVYEEELKPAVKAGATRIVILDAKGNDVTDNYALTLVNATLTITGDKLIPDKKAEDENIESNYKLGDEIEFTITVKNVSIYDVENVTVTDANAEIKAGNGYTVSADKHTATIAIIAAKSEIRIKALHTVTSEDILAGKVGNVANVEWKDGETTVTKTVDDDTTKLTPPNVTLNVTKTSDWEGKATGAKPELGTKITYTITVKNDGNVPYTNVNFTDLLQNGDASVTGEIPTYGTLPVNEEKSFTVEYIVTEADLLKESINNKVTAEADEIEYTYYEGKTEKTGKATPKGEAEVTDRTDDAKASTISTKTTTSKPKNEKGYELGETITYDIVVTNDGNLTVTDIEVKEELAGAVIKESTDGAYTVDGSIAKIAELKPGQSVTVKVEYVVTEADILAGSVKNEATVTGKGPDDKNPDPDKPGTEDPTDTPKAELNIEKSVLNAYTDNTPFKLGEKIEYQLTITTPETNNVTVKDVKVTDTLLTKANEGKFEITSLPEGAAAAYDNDGKLIITMPNIDPGKHELVIKYTYTVQETDLGTVKDGKATLGTVHNAATVAGTTDDPKVIPGSEDGNDVSTVAKLTITANDNSHVYDGKSHGARLNDNGQIKQNVSYTLDAELLDGHEIESVDIPFTAILVGVYDSEETGWLMPENAKIITAGGEDVTSKYYKITYVPGTLTITASTKELKIVANSTTWTYNGEQHTDGGYTVTYGNESYTVKAGESATLSTGDKVTAVVKGQVKDVDDTKAGNNEIVEWSVEHRDFYNNVTPANGTLTITPRKVTLKSDGGSKKYDGTPLTKPEVTVTGDGFVVGEVTGITATGSVTYVSQGEVDNLITFTKNEGFKDSNYEIKEIIGKLSIEALDVTIIITGPSAIREYKPGVTHTIVTGGSELDFVYGSDKVDGKIGVEGMLEGDKILPGTLKHTLEGMYVGEYEGVFTLFDSNGKKADKPTVMHDGVDVTENYKFSYNPGKLTITGKHMDGGKEVENEVPEKNYLLGQKIPFTITVRSVSKDELKDVTVTDPTATILPDRNTANPAYTVSEDEHTATITSLAPEAEVIVYAEHEVTEDDIINRYTNEATINWGNDEVKVSKTPSIEEENPEAELVKEIVLQDGQDENHKFKLGETVYFKITVTNTGNVTLNEYEVKEVLPGAAFIDGTGYTLNNDKTVATIEKMEPVKDGQEAPDSNQIVLYAQYNIKEEDLGNKELKNIVTADNSKPGEVPIPVDEAKSVSGQKIWKDEGNAFNTRPASITLTLMRKLGQNGAAEQYRTMQLGSNGSWRYSFDHLPKHDAQENEYFYWVVEEPVTGYDTAYETKDESHCDIVNNLQTYTLTIHYWQHKLGDTKMEQAFPDYVATLYYKQPYDVESPEREGIILDDMSQARISGTMPAHDLVIDVYYHRIAYRLTIHYIYQDGTMAHEDYTWTYWFNSTYNVPSPIIPGFTPSIDVIAGRMPSHGLELTVVYVGDSEIVIPDEDTSLGFKSYLNAGECFE